MEIDCSKQACSRQAMSRRARGSAPKKSREIGRRHPFLDAGTFLGLEKDLEASTGPQGDGVKNGSMAAEASEILMYCLSTQRQIFIRRSTTV